MSVGGDLRVAVRNLRAAPAYSAAAILTLALAIAANSAVFSAVYGVLLRPLPLRAPGDLVVGWETDVARGTPVVEVTYNQYRDWSRETRRFSHLAAMGSSTWTSQRRTRQRQARHVCTGEKQQHARSGEQPPQAGTQRRPIASRMPPSRAWSRWRSSLCLACRRSERRQRTRSTSSNASRATRQIRRGPE
jgi:hypothetical protein